MAASLTQTVVDAAPGNVITLSGAGLTNGPSANVTINNQGITAQPGLNPTSLTLPATFNTTSVAVTIPDGIMSGTLTVTASDGTTATCALRAVSQYAQASEYIGEGEDVTGLSSILTNAGVTELDVLLRRASSLIDTFLGDSLRLLQKLERHKYSRTQRPPPKLFPYRTSMRKCPIVSVDQITFVSAKNLVTVFNVNDIYVNDDSNYIEILAYAVGNYALLGQIQNIGYSASVIELSYTCGYPVAQYPAAVRDATIMTVTALLNKRRRQQMGLGPFEKFEDKLVVDKTAMKIPDDAKRALRPYVVTMLA